MADVGMNIPDFLSPRLVGKRFDGHSIPLEFLGDLAVLEPMIIEVAKWRYLRKNKDGKRSPRNFTDGITLTLTAVENGSAIAKIALALAVNSLIIPNSTPRLACSGPSRSIAAVELSTSLCRCALFVSPS
jgi:hypothetical protein